MKVLLTATVQSHICQFHRPLVEVLHEKGYEVHVAAKNNLAEKNGLKLDFVDKVYDIPFSRSPRSTQNIEAYKRLKKIINDNQYDIIHCNTPVAGVLTRLAARKVRKQGTKAFYTAHGFHFYKNAPKKNWLIFYPIEKIFADKFTDKLITITYQDYKLANNKFKCNIEHIHGVGVDSNRFHVEKDIDKHALRLKENLSDNDFVVLCTGELLPNKNQITLIEAINICKDEISNIKLLIAGNGSEKDNLEKLINKYNLADKVRLLGYRKDLENVLPCVDVVASASFREGLPLNIIEAMLSKKTVVASHNRGHDELIKDGISGYLVNPNLAIEFSNKFIECYKNPNMNMVNEAYIIAQDYIKDNVKKELENIYF